MNVIAGLLIGWVNDPWAARILVPFGWGIVWCLYQAIRGGDRIFVAGKEMAGIDPPPEVHTGLLSIKLNI